MANYEELDEILAFGKDLATTEQIQDLRARRGHENVRMKVVILSTKPWVRA